MKKSIKIVFIKQFPEDNEGTVYIRSRENGITKKKSLSGYSGHSDHPIPVFIDQSFSC